LRQRGSIPSVDLAIAAKSKYVEAEVIVRFNELIQVRLYMRQINDVALLADTESIYGLNNHFNDDANSTDAPDSGLEKSVGWLTFDDFASTIDEFQSNNRLADKPPITTSAVNVGRDDATEQEVVSLARELDTAHRDCQAIA
jgi:hypothetical protein